MSTLLFREGHTREECSAFGGVVVAAHLKQIDVIKVLMKAFLKSWLFNQSKYVQPSCDNRIYRDAICKYDEYFSPKKLNLALITLA